MFTEDEAMTLRINNRLMRWAIESGNAQAIDAANWYVENTKRDFESMGREELRACMIEQDSLAKIIVDAWHERMGDLVGKIVG